MRLILYILCSLCLLSVVVTNASASVEIEPNGSPSQANRIEITTETSGELNASDTDFFRFSVDDNLVRDIAIEFSGKPINADMCLYSAGAEKLKCSRSSTTRFTELALKGEYFVSISPVAKLANPVQYRFVMSPPRQSRDNYELEPNDRWEDAMEIGHNSKTQGMLNPGDRDIFKFSLSGDRELMRILVKGEALSGFVLRSQAGIKLLDARADRGEIRIDNLQLPQGNYAIRLAGGTNGDDRSYTLLLDSFGSVADVDLAKLYSPSEVGPPDSVLESEPNNSKGQAEQLYFTRASIGALTKSDTDMYHFYLPGHGRVRIEGRPAPGGVLSLLLDEDKAVKSKKVNDLVVLEHDLLPGDHFLRVRARPPGTGLYQLKMTQLGEFHTPDDKLETVSISLPSHEPDFAAYVPFGQRTSVNAEFKNSGSVREKLKIDATTSSANWRATPVRRELTLEPGESQQVKVDIRVSEDVRADIPTLVSIGARNAQNQLIGAHQTFRAQCDGVPQNGQQLWSIPEEFLGRINAAYSGFGGKIINEKRRDKDAIDGMVSRASGAWGRAGDEITIDLAGNAELTIIGVLLNPGGDGLRKIQLKDFEISTSVDGTSFSTVTHGKLTGDDVEQAFVFDNRVKAKFVRIKFINNHANSNGKLILGELKVLVSEPAHVILGRTMNIADTELGGNDIYSLPYAGGSGTGRHTFSSAKSDGQYAQNADQFEWVQAFRDNRAAKINEFVWHDNPNATRTERLLTSVVIEASMDSPLGPWNEIAQWSLNRSESGEARYKLASPVWARYVRFVAQPPSGDKPPYAPRQIQILEQRAVGDYRSILGEWGYAGHKGIYEYTNPLNLGSVIHHADASDRRANATLVNENQTYSGDVLVNEDVDWYKVRVPEGANQLTFSLKGNPVIEYAYRVEDEAGTMIADGIGGIQDESLILDVAPGSYYLKLYELPRSIIFSWDTSGSVRPFYDVIDQTMKTFASGVKQGREVVNLQPFSDPDQRFLLEDWSANTGVISSGIVNSDRKYSSSNVESSLLFSSKALKERQGTRAILLITDAETDGAKLTGSLWANLRESRPRIFAFEISSAGSPAAQDQMQSYARINNGFYDQPLSAGELQVGLDRAICMLRRPKPYHIVASLDRVPEKPDGFLLVELDASHVNRDDAVEVILDASGSMFQKIEDRFRYQIAKDVLDDLVASTLPDQIGFALRVFGNRDASSCRTDLEIELAPLDRTKAQSVINTIQPQEFAYTPIAASLLKVADDLEAVKGRRTVVLITDGQESCDGDVEAAIKQLKAGGIDVQLNVIGFDFDAADKEALRDEFRGWAALGGGNYFDATNASELSQSITEAVKLISHYDVETIDGDVVVQAAEIGATVSLRPGTYRIKAPGSEPEDRPKFVVRSAETTTVQLNP